MKKIFSFLLLGLLLSIGNAWADYAGFVLTSMPGSQTQSSGSIAGDASESWSWTYVANAGKSVYNNTSSSLWQIGSSSKPATSLTLSTSGISGTITKIVVSCASYQGKGTISATVNGEEFGTQDQSLPTWAASSTADITFTGSASGEIIITMTNGTSGQRAMYLKSVVVTYTTSPVTPTCATPTFTPAEGTYTFAQNVSIACTTEGSVIHYTTDGADPTEQSAVYSSPIAVTATTTIKAIAVANGYENSAIASATYAIVEHAGTLQDPYSVADAKLVTPATGTSENVYIRGTVSAFYNTSIMGDGTNYRYYISDDGTTTNQLLVYKGKGLNNVAFSNVDDLQIGDEVVILGGLTIYNTTYEIAANNYIVSLNRPVVASIDVNPNLVEVTCAETNGTINVTYNNISDIVADVYFCDSEGDAATYDWVTAEINAQNNVDYIIGGNAGAARTAYLKVYALDDESNEVYSELITISQAEYSVPYALAFDFTDAGWDFPTDYVTAAATYTNDGYSFTLGASSNGHKVLTQGNVTQSLIFGKKDATIVFPAFSFNVTAIKVYGYSGASANVTFNIFVDDAAVSTEVTSAKVNHTFAIDANSQAAGTIYTLKVTNANNCQVSKIEVYGYDEVTLGLNGYSTYAADFNYTVSGADAYKAKYQNGAVVLTQVNVIKAGEGIVLKGANAGDVVTITPSNDATDIFTDNELVGVLTPTLAQANWYVLATNLDGDGLTKFHTCQAGIEIPANKAYMVIGEATAPSIRIIEAGNEATDIQNVEGAEKAVKFMENGKLYILKNGVVYDAMGKTVR